MVQRHITSNISSIVTYCSDQDIDHENRFEPVQPDNADDYKGSHPYDPLRRKQKTVGLDFCFLPVPTVGVSLELLFTHPEIGGDPLEMGTLVARAQKTVNPMRTPLLFLRCGIRPTGIAWP